MTEAEKHKDSFDFGISLGRMKTQRALRQAHDNRKFEIEMYWRRAAYFWALITATFTGYFALSSAKNMPNKEFAVFMLACMGFIFSWAWFLTNRGSKYWQENCLQKTQEKL